MLHRILRRNVVIAATGTVLLFGSAGVAAAATINGTPTGNILVGTKYVDAIDGLAGNDIIDGREEADTILGGLGNDWIQGGTGADTITPGASAGLAPAASAVAGIDIRPGLFVNNGSFWSTVPTTTAGDRSVVRRTTGPNPGITATGPTGSVFHRTSGVSKYLFFGSGNHLLILESKAQAARVTHTVTQVDFTTSPPRERLIMTASASSAAVPPPRVQFSQGTGDAFFVFGSTGTQLVGVGIYCSGNGQIICGNQPISQLNVQLVAEATVTQVRIKDGGRVIRSCAKPTS